MKLVALVTNTIPPYCYDVSRVLALPHGFVHRFRYVSRWIHRELDLNTLVDRVGVTVLRHRATGRLKPLRLVRITNVVSAGGVHHLSLRVDSYCTGSLTASVDDALADYLKSGVSNPPGGELEPLVFEIGEESDWATAMGQQDSPDSWFDVVDALRYDCYKEFSFLKILSLKDAGGVTAPVKPTVLGEGGFEIQPGSLYELKVMQYVPYEIDDNELIAEPYDLVLSGDGETTQILRDRQKVVGKYDLLQFIFRSLAGHKTYSTFLDLAIDQGTELSKYSLANVFMPLSVKPPKWVTRLHRARMVVGGLSVLAFVFSGLIARLLSIPDGEWIRAGALLLLIAAQNKWEDAATAFVKESKSVRIGEN